MAEGNGTAVVLVFIASECPISNRYAPTLNRLYRDFSNRGVAFYLVYTDRADDVEKAAAHRREYALAAPALLDPGRDLVRRSLATVTPECAVWARSGSGSPRLVYRGRIDDRYADFGVARPAASQHDLREALDAVLAGRDPEHGHQRAVGCYIAPLERNRG